MQRISTGIYCLKAPGLNPATRPAVVSVDWQQTAVPEALAAASYGSASGGPCPVDKYAVVTERIVLDSNAANYFLDDDAADNVGFVIAVP